MTTLSDFDVDPGVVADAFTEDIRYTSLRSSTYKWGARYSRE